jgi:hypothetical protein
MGVRIITKISTVNTASVVVRAEVVCSASVLSVVASWPFYRVRY